MLDDPSGERLREERAETVRRIASLDAELNGIIESALLSNNDDEHDPDGATTGYERAKTTAMLQQAGSPLGQHRSGGGADERRLVRAL